MTKIILLDTGCRTDNKSGVWFSVHHLHQLVDTFAWLSQREFNKTFQFFYMPVNPPIRTCGYLFCIIYISYSTTFHKWKCGILGTHVWVPYVSQMGELGMGWNWSPMSGSHMDCVWVKQAWVRSGHLCLGPNWILYGLKGHGLEVVTYAWFPIRLYMG